MLFQKNEDGSQSNHLNFNVVFLVEVMCEIIAEDQGILEVEYDLLGHLHEYLLDEVSLFRRHL